MENNVMSELADMRTKIGIIQEEVAEVKSQCNQAYSDIVQLKEVYDETNSKVLKMETELESIKDFKERLQRDVEHMNAELKHKFEKLGELSDDIEKLERDSLKSTMRVFGLKEDLHETDDNLRQTVMDNVLQVASPKEGWQGDDIKSAVRVGAKEDNVDRMVVVTFRNDENKSKVYNGRDSLRQRGVRVSDYLTRRQRTQLDDLRKCGKKGYFYKGKLVELEANRGEYTNSSHVVNRGNHSGTTPRTFRRYRRN